MITDDSIERHPALLQREESSRARGAQLLDLRAPVSRSATRSAACSEHARFLLTDCLHFSRCQCSPLPTPLNPPSASIMTACVCAAAVYALPVTVARVASLASFAGFAIQADIAHQMHRAHAAWHAECARSACHADQVDCANVAHHAKDARSAEFASSANRARERPQRQSTVCRVGGFGSASGFLSTISQSWANRPSPLHFRQTHLHHTSCHRLHDLAHTHRPP